VIGSGRQLPAGIRSSEIIKKPTQGVNVLLYSHIHTLCFTRLHFYSNMLYKQKSLLIKQTKPPSLSNQKKIKDKRILNSAQLDGCGIWHCPLTGLEFTWLSAWVMQLLPIGHYFYNFHFFPLLSLFFSA
jgi:hypothetical protein